MSRITAIALAILAAANVQACNVGKWEPWTKCSEECGTGTKQRMRTNTGRPQ